MTKEEQIKQYMNKLDISREDAEQLWQDDQDDRIGEEGERMSQTAKAIKRYEQTNKPRKPVVREKKVDEQKVSIISALNSTIVRQFAATTETDTQNQVSFEIEGVSYTIKLIKHRNKK